MKFLRSCHKREPSEEEVPYPNIPIYAKKWPPPPDPDEITPANANLPSVADPTQQHQPETKQQEQANEDKPAYVPTHDPRPRFPEWGGWLAAVTRRIAIVCHGITLGFVQVLRFENDLQDDNPAVIEAQVSLRDPRPLTSTSHMRMQVHRADGSKTVLPHSDPIKCIPPLPPPSLND